jgi:Asp-tRNA(Asn)/Glu-tRNA(Gln) amidotransferase A subunit family amidase
VALKDNIDVRGVITTNASAAGARTVPERDAAVVRRLRAAGADLVCKTNLLEYAAGCVSPAYGMTYNPHDPQRTAGGSSSGSAALVAAGGVDFALGTDTGGSVRLPAAYCGVVGCIPSHGLIPTDGVTALAPSCDVVGTLTRTAEQAAVLLDVISDRKVLPLPFLSTVRIGVVREHLTYPHLDHAIRGHVESALTDLARVTNGELIDLEIPELALADAARDGIIMWEAWQQLGYLYATEKDALGPGTAHFLEQASQVDEQRYQEAVALRRELVRAMSRAFSTVDVIAGPTVPLLAPFEDPPIGTFQGDLEGAYTPICNICGLPAISVPCGTVGKLPVGLHLMADRGGEQTLLAVARTFEVHR